MHRKRALLIILFGFLIGLIAMGGARRYIDTRLAEKGEAQKPQEKREPVVIVKTDVERGKKLDGKNLELATWPADLFPPTAFRRIAEVENRVTLVDLVKGEPILVGKLAVQGASPGLSAFIASGMRAMTVKVNEIIGVGGFVAPGSRVDVLVTMDLAGQKKARTVTKLILQNIQVLAVDRAINGKGDKESKKVSFATLLVNPDQAERLALAATRGEILLALRNNLDGAPATTAGITPPELVLSKASFQPSTPPAAKPAPVKKRVLPIQSSQKYTIEIFRGTERFVKELVLDRNSSTPNWANVK